MPYEHKETNGIQDIEGKQREEEGINTIPDNKHRNNGENIVRTVLNIFTFALIL